MNDTENMTFEKASEALVQEMKAGLDQLRARFAGQTVNWSGLQELLTKSSRDCKTTRRASCFRSR